MAGSTLGEFEHHVMLAVLRLGKRAYSVSIFSELETQLGRGIQLPAVYVALRRLEKRELVSSRLVVPDEDKGDARHPRRYVKLTDEGLHRLKKSRDGFLKLWDGVEARLDA